mmetsp:Transcript_38450/g.46388  ORF Transcript_38450/g.46388 Transcript_38450/m.46388 type:complete len:182 (+) Transcript_38450:567-1112(+)|eukprot:CAMPEP_0197852336 /NCGR_PEP_ID=MMETSP1438-20131217/20313_1 /TAXON_ID=1461541 /ORGANISM="Pterosperma sp., Strain CCMP1384" /LENGTH=181 /DNA_ID=CAMNT_0043466331 /DNA_START=516 /DNA_END=1061 /DNA_ORIENTATION=+
MGDAPKKKLTSEEKTEKMRQHVFSVMQDRPLHELSKSKVRRLLEEKFELEKGALDNKKDKIDIFVQEFVDRKNNEEEEEEEVEQPPAKKPKTSGGGGGQPDVKGIKKKQANMMTATEFQEIAPELKTEIFGAEITGPARSFTSGNRGWYAGGKKMIKVAGKDLWVQIGLNVTVIGSKEWAE